MRCRRFDWNIAGAMNVSHQAICASCLRLKTELAAKHGKRLIFPPYIDAASQNLFRPPSWSAVCGSRPRHGRREPCVA